MVSGMLFLLAISLEIVYRGIGAGDLPAYISVINFILLILLVAVTALHTRIWNLNQLVCPLLTILNFLYLAFVDYDYTLGSIYYS